MARFVKVHHRMINIDQIAYVDFLDSGRAMIFMSGLSLEKQNIPVEPEEARRLLHFMEGERADVALPAPGTPALPPRTFVAPPLRSY